jgi:hyperosmotically inducible periplasmic protein
MKKWMIYALVGVIASTTMQACKKKMSDADITTAVQNALKEKGMTGTTVSVDKGVVTLGGECKDAQCKADCEAIAKGIKGGDKLSIVNNCTIAPVAPPPASLTTTLTNDVMQKVKDGLKDIKGITLTFEGTKAVVSGALSNADKMKVAQIISAAKVTPDLSKVTSK